jgi:hypothetical protein
MGMVCDMNDKRNTYRVLVGKPEGKRPLGRHGHRLEDNIKMDLEIGWDGMVWTGLFWLKMGKSGGFLCTQ